MKRLAKFIEYSGLDGNTTEEKARIFAEYGNQDVNWAFSNILKFVQYQLHRVNKKEITPATLRNYVTSSCEMAELQIPWKKITKGLPKERWLAIILEILFLILALHNSSRIFYTSSASNS